MKLKTVIINFLLLSITLWLWSNYTVQATHNSCYPNWTANLIGGFNHAFTINDGDTVRVTNLDSDPSSLEPMADWGPLSVTFNGRTVDILPGQQHTFNAVPAGDYNLGIVAGVGSSGDNDVLFSVECVTPPPSSSGANSTSINPVPDDRLNWRYGDAHICIAYENSAGNLDIYLYSNSQYYSNVVTEEDMAAYRDNPPANDILLWREANVAVYASSSGLRLVCGPDSEGKVYTWTMDYNNLRDGEGTYFDPNE